MQLPWNQPLDTSVAHCWTIGPLVLWFEVGDDEIRVATTTVEGDVILHETGVPAPAAPERFAGDVHAVQLTARCADRPVVVRPATPLSVLPGQQVDIHVSTAAWIGLRLGDRDPFFEVPSLQPNSTWFGATPQAGELAYASRSKARTEAGLVQLTPGRVLTRVTLENPIDQVWPIERVKVPAPYLPLYATDSGLCTPGLRMRNALEGETGIEIATDGPTGAQRLSGPRLDGTPKLLLRALGKLGWPA